MPHLATLPLGVPLDAATNVRRMSFSGRIFRTPIRDLGNKQMISPVLLTAKLATGHSGNAEVSAQASQEGRDRPPAGRPFHLAMVAMSPGLIATRYHQAAADRSFDPNAPSPGDNCR